MKAWFLNLWNLSKGYRVMAVGVVLVVAAFALVFAGKVGTGPALVVVTIACTVAGLSGKLNRHQAEVLLALGVAAKAGIDYRKGDNQAVLADLKPLGALAAAEVLPALAIHVSGSDPKAVLQAVTALTAKEPTV
jgi:hypothetical protein